MDLAKKALEEQVVLLKQQFGKKLKIHKGNPWPLKLSILVEPPSAAHAQYDVEPVEVQVILHDGCLQILQQLQAGQASSSDNGNSIDVAAAAQRALTSSSIQICVDGVQLAPMLCQKISMKLADMWTAFMAKQFTSGMHTLSLGLFVPAQMMERQFVSLVTSMPELVEAYTTVDELGRTVRRFTIIQPADTHLAAPAGPQQDESGSNSSALAPVKMADQPGNSPAAGLHRPAEQQQQQRAAVACSSRVQQSAATSVGKNSNSNLSQQQQQQQTELLPASIQVQNLGKDLQYFARRYPGQLTLVQPDHTGQPTAVSAAQVQQLLQQHLPDDHKQALQKLGSAPGHEGPQVPVTAAEAPKHSKLSAAAVPFVPSGTAGVASAVAAATKAINSMQLTTRQQQQQSQATSPPHQQPAQPLQNSRLGTQRGGLILQLELLPTDPAWERGHLLLSMQVMAGSIQGAADILLVVSRQCVLPLWLREALDKAMMEAVLSSCSLREAVRHVENYASQLEAAAKQQARAAGVRTGLGQGGMHSTSEDDASEHKGRRSTHGLHGSATGSSAVDEDSSYMEGSSSAGEYETDETETEGGEEEGEEDWEGSSGGHAATDEVQFSGAADVSSGAAAGAAGGPDAWAVVLEGLQLDHLVAVEALRTVLQVCCARCAGTGSLSIASDAVSASGSQQKAGDSSSRQLISTAECPGCHTPWSITLRPKFVHTASNVLCVVKAVGCTPRDLLPSLYAGQCESCSAVMSLRNVQVGMAFERSCSSCHHALALHIPAVSFVPRGPPGGGQGVRGQAPTRRSQAAARASLARQHGPATSAVLQVGSPLPANGACKHYKHSYRWLRFPCCGQRYPCDLCHDEYSADGHEPRWATRMVCGFCSTEQPVASQCAACGKKLATSGANPSGRQTRFWEGGQGCRDKSRMHRKDPHKYRNSNNKTKSAKHTRVGPKAWSKELKREQEDS